MTQINDDHIKEVLSIIRGAARTPLMGMTKNEIEGVSRLSIMKIEKCIDSLLSHKLIVLMGQRGDEAVYGIMEE